MKKICLFLTFLMIVSAQSAKCAQTSTAQPQTYASYQSCLRQYQLPFEKLYYLALSAVNSNKFEILEMQSRSGYILFEYNNKEFLLSIMKKDNKTSFIKLTPADNDYYFSSSIPQRIFSTIDMTIGLPVQEIK